MDKIQDFNPLVDVLFDRKNDPNQLNNLFNEPEHQKIKDSLKVLTLEWMQEYKDSFLTSEEFDAIEPNVGWSYNCEKSPYELLNNKNR